MNLTHFMEIIKEECEDYGVKCQFSDTRSVSFGDNIESNGYFDDEDMLLVVSLNQPVDAVLRLLAHEFGHFQQWKANTPGWYMLKNHPILEREEYNEYPDVCSLFFGWIAGELEMPENDVRVAMAVTRDMEIECERMAVENIKKYHLDVDLVDYVKRANAYILFYTALKETRKWYAINKEPYNSPQIVGIMPHIFRESYSSIEPRLLEMYRAYCYDD